MGVDLESQAMLRPGSLISNFVPEISRTARLMTDADVVIYPVDAKGLEVLTLSASVGADAQTSPYVQGNQSLAGIERAAANLNQYNQDLVGQHDAMRLLAERTGGVAFYNTNDIKGAIRHAIDDSRVTYVVAYSPSHGIWDGRFHELKLRSSRRSLKLRYRRGYFATPDPPVDDNRRRLAVQAAILSPLDSTSIGLEAQASPLVEASKNYLNLLVTVDLHGVVLERKDDLWVGKIEIVMAEPTNSGEVGTGDDKTAELRLKPENYERVMKRGLQFKSTFKISGNGHQMRLIIYDYISGSIGSLTIPLDPYKPS
jgi:hypothetical protein